MKKIYFTLLMMSVCSLASAQVVIENPAVGSVVFKEQVLELNGQEVTSFSSFPNTSTEVVADSVAAGETGASETLSSAGVVLDVIRNNNWQGMIEFDLQNVEMPTSFTTSNFTARLVGISGQAATDGVSLSIDLFDMADANEDFVIQEADYFDNDGQMVSINGDPYINGEFESGEIDVTAQLRADLFGNSTVGASSGFILQASGGTGLVAFPGIADAYIEMNLIGSDTDEDTDSGTGDVTVSTDSDSMSDTDTQADTATGADTADTADSSDSDSVTDTATGSVVDTATSSGNAGTGDSDYWETEDDDSDGIGNFDGGDGGSNVKCTCTAAGSTAAKSLWNLLF